MPSLYEQHTKQASDPALREYQWVVFDPLTTDEELKRLLAPIAIEDISRESGHSPMCTFYSDRKTSYAILAKVRSWEKQHIPPRRQTLREKAAAQSRERFHRYLEECGLAKLNQSG